MSSMSEPRVRFCPFCGSGTLFIDPDNVTGYGCMKCKRGFQVGVRTDAAPPVPGPNPDPIRVVTVMRCIGCGIRAPWCTCGRGEYR